MVEQLKPEVYSCLKMLESLRDRCRAVFNSGNRDFDIAWALLRQYLGIVKVLEKHLTEEQLEFLPEVNKNPRSDEYSVSSSIQETLTASALAVAYLKSLGGSLGMELSETKKELEAQKKLYKDSLEILKEVKEVYRSGAVAEWKKHHREIEENSRKPEQEDKN